MLKIIFTIFSAVVILAFLALPQFSLMISRFAVYIQNFNEAISPIAGPEVIFFLSLAVLMFIAAILSVIRK